MQATKWSGIIRAMKVEHTDIPDDSKSGLAVDDDRSEDQRPARPREIGGCGGPDPTRYGDWEKAGRCIDF